MLRPRFGEEVTLQPIRRFDFDAAILFADIYSSRKLWDRIYGLRPGRAAPCRYQMESLSLDGRKIFSRRFLTQCGACLNHCRSMSRLSVLPVRHGPLPAIWWRARHARSSAGAPFGAYDAAAFQSIIDVLIAATIEYLAAQVAAGAEVLQIFESWAASFEGDDFERWCVAPVAAIIAGLRARGIKPQSLLFLVPPKRIWGPIATP